MNNTFKKLSTVTAAEIVPETARFAWAGRIPLGAVTVLAGPPGQGKTQLLLGACARATRGKLPGDLAGEPVETLFVSAEDSLEHTLAPRAQAAGGDLRFLHFLRAVNVSSYHGDEEQPCISIPEDLPALDEWLAQHPARLIVLDPIVALMPVSLNAHRDQHVRRALAPLARLADERSAAVICVMHLNKNLEADALNRLSGSIGFGGAARSVLLFAQDPDDPDGENGNRRILAHVKCNVGPRQSSIAYAIEPRTLTTSNGLVQTSVAVRVGDVTASANDLLSGPTSAGEASARTEARDFLQTELSNGPVTTNDLKTRAEDAGVAWRTIERAKKQLSIRSRKNGAIWQWELPQPLNTPPGGVGGIGGDEGNTAKSAMTADIETLADIDAEAERLLSTYGNEIAFR